MGRPVMLVDNVFNPRIYGSHTIAASSTATGTNALNLSAGRRVGRINVGGWFASSLNTDAYVRSTFDRPRAFDMLFIDRGHNLAGESVSVLISDDAFTTYETVGPLTVPSNPTPYSALYDDQIIMTDEGALIWWLGLRAGYAVEVFVAAMGAGLRPELTGLMLGKSWSPAYAQIKPFDYGRHHVIRTITRSAHAQSVSADVGRFRQGTMRLRAESWEEYATARYPLEDLYLAGHAMVLMHSDEEAERAALVIAPAGQAGFEVPSGEYLPEIAIPFEETEPVIL